MNRNIIFPILYFTAFTLLLSCDDDDDSKPTATEWDYENADAWGTTLGYSDCAGKVQSPINIETDNTVKAILPALETNYINSTWGIVDNGHTLQVNLKQTNKLILDGTVLKVIQFHFHRKSEHTINGDAYAMEMHIVHQDTVTSNLAVIAIFLKEGNANPFLEKIWSKIPAEENIENISAESINLMDAFPGDKKYYTYTGSLTTPPCSQGIDWIIIKEPMEISAEQISLFSSIHSNNARPTQALNYREVIEGI